MNEKLAEVEVVLDAGLAVIVALTATGGTQIGSQSDCSAPLPNSPIAQSLVFPR